MSKMVYPPYVRFEQEEGEAEGIGWYFTQYNAETGEGRGWHGTEFMPDCLFETKCEGDEKDFIKAVKLGMELAKQGYDDVKYVDPTGLYGPQI